MIDRIFLIGLTAVVTALVVTALPSLSGQPLGGTMLMLHMMASGALVFLMPVFAIVYLFRSLDPAKSNGLGRFGFWSLVTTGLITIATVFACMLPLFSTEQMHTLVMLHGYAGYAMVPALLASVFGISQWRCMAAKRSSTAG